MAHVSRDMYVINKHATEYPLLEKVPITVILFEDLMKQNFNE